MKKKEAGEQLLLAGSAQCPFCGDWFTYERDAAAVAVRPFGDNLVPTPFHFKPGREIHVDDRVGCGCASDLAVRTRRGN